MERLSTALAAEAVLRVTVGKSAASSLAGTRSSMEALERGYTPASRLDDRPRTYPGAAGPWRPRN